MRKNISKVIEAFKARKSAVGDSKRSCHTDGETIYSYSTPIGGRRPDGTLWITSNRYTRTTNAQIAALRVALACHAHTDCNENLTLALACASETR